MTAGNTAKSARGAWIILWMLGGGYVAGMSVPAALQSFSTGIAKAAGRPDYDAPNYYQPVTGGASFLFGAIVFTLIGTIVWNRVERSVWDWDHMTQADKLTLLAGVFIGVIVSIPFLVLFFSFGAAWVVAGFAGMFALIIVCATMMRNFRDVLPWSSGPMRRSNVKVFDTSVIIDGRFYDVCKSGFLEGRFYVPQFVISELQHIADSHEPNRRQRGRRGLDILNNLQNSYDVTVGLEDRLAGSPSDPVDTRLVTLAKALGASLVTNDFNLSKVAALQNVPVMNLNDLAMSLRPVFLPGDMLNVEVEKSGSQHGQGIGYLEDGTMIVIENGEFHLGERVEAHVTQVHQSTAGRMIFASINEEEGGAFRKRARS
ncbi:MAG: TRAM domain-containing protein [Armatimonadota bacterium]|nr:TRAM domain-containing protein [Armatimonadota bacterium]